MGTYSNRIARNRIVRHASALVRQVPRTAVRLGAVDHDYRRLPPAIGNSFPKSGTHLLLQILRGFAPHYYGSFINSKPPLTFRERGFYAHLRLLDRIVPGEALPAHLFYHDAYATVLARKNVVHFFICRDPRDVCISDAHYLTNMNPWHRMHHYFARILRTDEERISAAILGVHEPDLRCDYPDITRRFAPYRGWLGRDDVFVMRFEDLTSPHRAETVRRMATFYAEHCRASVDVNGLTQLALGRIDAARSHTFRKGEPGAWRTTMTSRHIAQIEDVAGQLLVELGYRT
jgi:sulfotransferase 6B1